MLALTIFNAVIYGYIALQYDSDPMSCLAGPESDQRFVTYSQVGEADIGLMWRGLFTGIFYLYCIQLLVDMTLQAPWIKEGGQVAARSLQACTMCIMTFFILQLIVSRLTHEGRVCSGDFLEPGESTEGYLIEQGFFLKVLLILQLSMICTGCTAIAVLCAAK